MDMAMDFPVDHTGPLNAPIEVFERGNENHPAMDGINDHHREVEAGWDMFPGLLPA
jgi:hypothetical protein